MTGSISWLEKIAFLAAHPKGTYFWTDDPTNPRVKYGAGEWELLEAGRFLTAACDPQATDQTYAVGSEGGSTAVKIQINHLPVHSHTAGYDDSGNAYAFLKGVSGTVSRKRVTVGSSSDPIAATVEETANLAVGTRGTGEAGGGEALDIMPLYRAAYCWYRTA